MTDMTIAGASRAIDVTSPVARGRIKRRYRAEARFRAYGIAAILFAVAFLVLLVSDIFYKAMPAFTINSISLTVDVTPEAIDPDATGRAEVIANGDFMVPIRTALLKEFPDVASDRKARAALTGLISSAGPDELRRVVLADPGLIGKTTTIQVLLSDDADLYFKGRVGDVFTESTRGIGSPSATAGTVTVFSSANDFSGVLVEVKRTLSVRAREIRSEVKRFEDLLANIAAQRTAAEAELAAARVDAIEKVAALEGRLAKLESDRQSLSGQIATLGAQAADLEKRFSTASAPETLGPDVQSLFVEINGGIVKVTELANDRATGTALIPLSSVADATPGNWRVAGSATPEVARQLSDQEIVWLRHLDAKGAIASGINWRLFRSGDSREAELAGILGALVGSAFTMLVTLLISLPIGVGAAIYLEEFAPKNRWTDVIEVNINNLAAVPSIIFGLLGLAVFLNFFGLPRSTALVGGLVLALLVLPTIIIASRAALKAVPPSIREAALGVGASHQQAVFHHVLPVAMPGVLTGTIIGMAHALGETAPLLLIGMIAFIVDVPHGVTDAATVLPVQIFLWSDLPEIGFQAKTSAAIIVLLVFLLIMNGAAILLRRRFERRW
jgi:phosphate transport system permease protein